jgi:fibronectin-binding autotransporter adhesin
LTLPNALGYDMIEEYAQQIQDQYASQTAITGDWATAVWSSTTPGIYDHALIRGNGTTNGAVTIGSSDSDNAFSVSIGGNGPAAGETLTMSGGSLVVQDTIYVGDQNNGTLNMSGGTVRTTNIQLGNTVYDSNGNPTNYTGTFNFTGGTLQIMAEIVQGVGTAGSWTSGAAWNWSGGTLEPLAAFTVSAPATIGSGGAIVNSNGFNGTFSGALGGTGAFTKTGAGIVTLSASNSFGTTNINAGEISIASDANIGGSTSAINFNGGLLQVTGTALTNIDSHTVNWSSFNGGFDIASASNTFTVSENISGSGSMSVNGSGILYLTGNNSYTGGTFLNGGFLEIASTASLGGASAPLNFEGGSLYVTGTSVTTIDSYNVNWSSFNGGFNIASASNTFSIGQVLGGSGSLTKSGPGVLLLNAANTFTGTTTITGGTLRLGNALALQDSTVALSTSGVTLDLNGYNATFGGLSGNQGIDLKGTTLTVGGNNASTAYSGVISDSMPGGTAGMLIKTGSGTWTLSGASTFTGPLEVSNGIISVATLANGGTASPWGKATNVAANLILNGGTLQYTGSSATGIDRLFTLTANGGTLDGAASAGFQLTNSGSIAFTGTGNRTLTLAGTGTNNAFSFALGDPISGMTSLTMNGTGRWILNGVGALTYSGTTTVAAGTLLDLNKTNVLPYGAGKGNLSISTGATFEMNGQSNNINALVGAGTMDNRSGTAVLTLGNGDATGTFSGAITAAGGALSIVKTGVGTQTLTGANTYVGSTTVSSGTLELASPGSLTSTALSVSTGAVLNIDSGTNIAAATVLTDNGTTNFVSPTKSIATLNGAGTLNLNPTVLTMTAGGSFSGVIEGGGGPVAGGGSLVLSGVNTYTGATSVTVGSLEIASPGSLASTSVSVAASTLLTVDSGAALSSSTQISDSGTTTFKNASQTIATLNGTSKLNLTSTALTVSGGGTFSGVVAGTGSLAVSGGALKLSGVDTYSGPTSVNGGSLEIASPGSLGDATVGVAANTQLTVDSGASLSSSTNLTDGGTASFANATQSIATLNGAGTLNLNPTILSVTAGGTFSGGVGGSGGMTITGGALQLSGRHLQRCHQDYRRLIGNRLSRARWPTSPSTLRALGS